MFSNLKKIPIETLKYLVKENTNEEKAAQNIRFAQLKERALRNDEICIGSIKISHLYDLDIEAPLSRSSAPLLKRRIETMDAYIPEPLRNRDGAPIYPSIRNDEQHIDPRCNLASTKASSIWKIIS